MDTQRPSEKECKNLFSSRQQLNRSPSDRSGRSLRNVLPQHLFAQGNALDTWKHLKDHNLKHGLPTLEQVLIKKSASPVSLQDFYDYLRDYPEGRKLLEFWQAVHHHEELLRGGDIYYLSENGNYRKSTLTQYLNQSAGYIYTGPPRDSRATAETHPNLYSSQSSTSLAQGPAHQDQSCRPSLARSRTISTDLYRLSQSVPVLHPHELQPGAIGPFHSSEAHLPASFGLSPGMEPYPSHHSYASAEREIADQKVLEEHARDIIRTYFEIEAVGAPVIPRLLAGKEGTECNHYFDLVEANLLFPTQLQRRLQRAIESHGFAAKELFDEARDHAYTVLNHRYYSLFLQDKTSQNMSSTHGTVRLILGGLLLAIGLTIALYFIFTNHRPRNQRLVSLPFVILGWWNIIAGLTRCAPELAMLGL
ncbi:Bud site selection protein, Revert to axial protein 1 [Dimargaris verticillata]|uniref:Bud site selection protein, Revert to axial protein 1 n=1 Tax=Dimargaris verticillata TaxID=2761393 RepID=A0A9W8BBJ1_9FUNG|nr:Bud site selection protein, Revert to axial protein 1 [Dimargaris verticillata]